MLLTGERDGYYADFAVDPATRLARALAEGFVYQGEPSTLRAGRPLAAAGHAIGGAAVFVLAWVAPDLVHPAAAQRAAFAAWFAWLAGAGWATGAARA